MFYCENKEAEGVQELLLKIISFPLLYERTFFSVKEGIFLCKTSPLPGEQDGPEQSTDVQIAQVLYLRGSRRHPASLADQTSP